MDHLIHDLYAAVHGEISDKQKEVLAEAHRVYHMKHSGPLSWESQVVIYALVGAMEEMKQSKGASKTTAKNSA
mgnify:FL=1|tara:strand:- start:420 stop:638 length:219 start_codon:yes stop_codon:yes gene_type:complete